MEVNQKKSILFTISTGSRKLRRKMEIVEKIAFSTHETSDSKASVIIGEKVFA